jgi:hypothetical protein
MIINYVELYIKANIQISLSQEKEKLKLTNKIIKLQEWANEDVRRMKDENKRIS